MAEGLKESPRQPALQQRLAAYIAQMPVERSANPANSAGQNADPLL